MLIDSTSAQAETKIIPFPVKRYRSMVEWPADVFTASDGSHITSDDHFTEEAAKAVITMLKRHGFGGNGRLPISAWVEPVKVTH